MKIKFIPLDYDYFSKEGKTYIKIYGKTNDRKDCCIIDEAINFFYVLTDRPEKLIAKVKQIKNVKNAELVSKNFMEMPLKAIKVFCERNKMEDIAHAIKRIQKVETRERDINQVTRYIIEKKVKPLVWQEIEGDVVSEGKELTIKLEKVKEAERQQDFKPKIMAFDIEASEIEIDRGKILMISLVTDNFQKVLTWKEVKRMPSYMELCKDEAEMLRKFAEYIKKENPDIITGYFTDGFDFPYIRTRAETLGINLQLGNYNQKIIFSKGRPLNARIKGLVHIDLFKVVETFYSQYLQSETLGLDDVAKELLGEGKHEHEFKKPQDLKEEEWRNFFRYNLQDSLLTYKLFHKLWHDIQEFTKIVQEPPFTVSRQGMSGLVESYIIHNLNRFNEIAERRPLHEEIEKRRHRRKYEGAFVLQPKAALYENLAIFDFTSYWPSIIVTFNLSRSTFLGEKKHKDALEVEIGSKKYYFSKKKGMFSKLLGEIIELRKKYKQELRRKPDPIKKVRSNAFKLLANASYGYQGFFGARYYCPEASASTTAISRDFIKKIIGKMNKQGYKVIYADTDGFAFLLQKHTKKDALNFLHKLNNQLPGIMELELEDFFDRGIWVTKRTGEFGAKKKYALINHEGKLKIRGFETVRRDWCKLAREVQNEVLRKILKTGSHETALKYVQDIIKKLRKRGISKKELIIKTQLKKPISEYKAEGPHVTIAKKMQRQGLPIEVGILIRYYVAETKDKKARVRDRAKLPDEPGNYDLQYYLKHQILPAIENIFEVFGVKEHDIVSTEQKKLGQYFG